LFFFSQRNLRFIQKIVIDSYSTEKYKKHFGYIQQKSIKNRTNILINELYYIYLLCTQIEKRAKKKLKFLNLII